MKKKLLFFAMALGVLTAQAQNAIPYLPQADDFQGAAVSDLSSFVPPASDYTLQVQGVANQEINVANGTYTYTPTTSAAVRFAQFNGKVFVYEGDKYMTTLTPVSQNTFPTVYAEVDDQSSSSGIYSTSNLFKNPGFETLGEDMGGGMYKAVDWESNGYDYGSKSRVRINTADFTEYEGEATFMMHGYGGPAEYLAQKIEGLESNSIYKVMFTTWSHNNTDNGEYSIAFGNAISDNSIASGNFNTGPRTYLKRDQSFEFTTPASLPTDVYFTITRLSTAISHFDRMVLVKGIKATGIVGTTSATYVEGAAFAPVLTLEEGDYFDMTSMLANPDFEQVQGDKDQVIPGWIKEGESNSEYCTRNDGGPAGFKNGNVYFQNWRGNGAEADFSISQQLTGLPNGNYDLVVAAGGEGEQLSGTFVFANEIQQEVTATGDQTINIDIEDGELTIGFKSVSRNHSWSYADNFRLYYYGPSVPTSLPSVSESNDEFIVAPARGGINVITSVKENVKIYTIVGQTVKQTEVNAGTTFVDLAAGMYIVNGQKVIVK